MLFVGPTTRVAAAWALPAFFVLSGMLCGPSGPFLWPELENDPLNECQNFSCPIAVGTEVRLRSGFFDTDISVAQDPSKLTFSPLGIVDLISINDGVVTIRGLAKGRTTMTAIIDGDSIVKEVSVLARATSQIVAMDYVVPPSMARTGLAMMTGTNLGFFARHFSAEGKQLMAEGIESWSLGESSSAEITELSGAHTLHAGAVEETLSVSAGVGDPLRVDVVSPGAIASVSLLLYGSGLIEGQEPSLRLVEGDTISVSMNAFSRSLHVAALSIEGLFIVGAPIEVLAVPEDLVSLNGDAGQFITLRPVATGTGSLRFRVGEREVTYAIEVTK